MTTAHRPTWAAAVGGSEQGGNRKIAPTRAYSSRDLPGHLKVKTRKPGQGTQAENLQRDFRRELEEKEQKAKKPGSTTDDQKEVLKLKSKDDPANIDADDDVEEHDSSSSDSDNDSQKGSDHSDSDSKSDSSSNSNSDSDDDDEDDDEELMRELEKIKRERAEEQERKRQEEEQELARKATESMIRGNPLLNVGDGSYAIKRRWDDDVVFKNQGRKDDQEKKKRFINDTLRNDFHRSFLKKYIR